MTLRPSRRRAMQAALVTAAAVTLPRSRAAAQPATPAASGDATITAAQVQAAVDRLDALIEDGMTKTGVPGTAVAVVHNDTVVYERGFGVRELGRPEPITPDTVFPDCLALEIALLHAGCCPGRRRHDDLERQDREHRN